MARPYWFLGGFGALLLVLLGMQIYADSFRLGSLSIVLLIFLFGVALALAYPDIIKLRVGPSGFAFERQAIELTQKLLTAPEAQERTVDHSEIVVTEADSSKALPSMLAEVEDEMGKLAGMGEIADRPMGFDRLVQTLTSRRLLDDNLHAALEFLKYARDSVYYGGSLTVAQTKAAMSLAGAVLWKLKEKKK